MICVGGVADGLEIKLDPPGEHFCIGTKQPARTDYYCKIGGEFLCVITGPLCHDDIVEDADLVRQLIHSGRFKR
jgi:hypothetical protein